MFRYLFLGTTAAFLFSCASMNHAPDQSFVDERIAQANKLNAEGDLHGALIQLRIAQRLSSDAKGVEPLLSKLEAKRISELSTLQSKLENQQLTANQQRQTLLRILALEPESDKYIQQLRYLVAQGVPELVNTKTDKPSVVLKPAPAPKKIESVTPKVNTSLAANNTETSFQEHLQLVEEAVRENDVELAKEHIELATQIRPEKAREIKKKFQNIKKQESERLYGEGVRVLYSDVKMAVLLFEKSLEIDPNNDLAQERLEKASRMLENLNQIKHQN